MSASRRIVILGLLGLALAGPAAAQSTLNEQDLIQKLTPGMTLRSIKPVLKPGDATAAKPAAPSVPAVSVASPPPAAVPAQPVPPPPRVALDIKFEFASDRLDPRSYPDLDVLGRAINSGALKTYRFEVAGHTDAVGTPERNQRLSERRAQSVLAYLVSVAKVAPDRLTAVGYGESRLADPAHPNSGVNRRVEVTTLVPMAAN